MINFKAAENCKFTHTCIHMYTNTHTPRSVTNTDLLCITGNSSRRPKRKRKNFKAARGGRRHITFKGAKIRLTANF